MHKSRRTLDGSYKPSASIITFLLLMGLVFAGVGGSILYHTARIRSEYIKTNATIVSFESRSYRGSDGKTKSHTNTYIEYEIDGREYAATIGEYSSTWHVGDTIEVYCNPSNYNDVESGSVSLVLGIIFFSIGIFVMLIPVFMIVRTKSKKRGYRELIQNGVQVYATVIDIGNNPTVAINGRHPVVLYLEYVDYNGTQHRFKSQNLWRTADYSAALDKQLPVYYDRNDMDKYYVDTTPLFDAQFLNSNIVYH